MIIYVVKEKKKTADYKPENLVFVLSISILSV